MLHIWFLELWLKKKNLQTITLLHEGQYQEKINSVQM